MELRVNGPIENVNEMCVHGYLSHVCPTGCSMEEMGRQSLLAMKRR